MAGRVGFEPTEPREFSGFQDRPSATALVSPHIFFLNGTDGGI